VIALAVAPEPWPFWDGEDEADRVALWREQVGWRDEWGTAEPAGRVNGSSGQVVRDRVLKPLGLTLDSIWLTDALPYFLVHRGAKTQGAAMADRYDPFAAEYGLPVHHLPSRPSPAALIARARTDEADRMRQELRDSAPPLIITLGDEALAVATAIVDGPLPARLSTSDYGTRHQMRTADGQSVKVLPLVHPGQRSQAWRSAHEQWMRAARAS